MTIALQLYLSNISYWQNEIIIIKIYCAYYMAGTAWCDSHTFNPCITHLLSKHYYACFKDEKYEAQRYGIAVYKY